ncbi:MAG TPA: carboxymuconolactone decarboxylase family protein [Gammaproteobacteria bacterium]
MRVVIFLAVSAAGFSTAFGQSAPGPAEIVTIADDPAAIDPESGSRLPFLTREDMADEAGVQIYDALAASTGTPPRGTLAIALHSPETAAALGRIETYLRSASPLGPRLAELARLVTARELNLPYEWSEHEPAALLAGVPPAVIEAVRWNGDVGGLPPDDALLIDFGRQLFRNRHVDAETFAAMVERLGRQRTFDAIMALTYGAMAGILQRAVDQRPPAGWDPQALPDVPGVGTPSGRPGEFVALGPRPPLPADVHEESYYRFRLLRRDELDPRGREIFDRLVGADRDAAPLGPVGMTLNSPELAEPIQQLNSALRQRGVLGTRTAEIVIAATGREMNSQYQWVVHGAAAERAGAGHDVLDAIRDDGDLSKLDERDAVAIAFTRELFREATVRPETFAAALEQFGTRGVVEIAALVGDYLMVTTMYNALGMRLRADQEPTLPHRVGAPVGAEWR